MKLSGDRRFLSRRRGLPKLHLAYAKVRWDQRLGAKEAVIRIRGLERGYHDGGLETQPTVLRSLGKVTVGRSLRWTKVVVA